MLACKENAAIVQMAILVLLCISIHGVMIRLAATIVRSSSRTKPAPIAAVCQDPGLTIAASALLTERGKRHVITRSVRLLGCRIKKKKSKLMIRISIK